MGALSRSALCSLGLSATPPGLFRITKEQSKEGKAAVGWLIGSVALRFCADPTFVVNSGPWLVHSQLFSLVSAFVQREKRKAAGRDESGLEVHVLLRFFPYQNVNLFHVYPQRRVHMRLLFPH